MTEHSEACEQLKNKIRQRWVTVVLGFLGLLNAYAMRVCLSIAITEMTLPHRNITVANSNDTYADNNSTNLIASNNSDTMKYDWSEQTQGLILSSFYWGYIISNIFGGTICQKFGGKHTLGVGILFTAIFTILTPFAVQWGGSTALIILRAAMGFGEGTTIPAISDLLAKWIPRDERSKAGAIVFSGGPLGTVFGMLISGVILQHSEIGWPMVFYFYGSFGIMSFLLNCAFCYSRPSENPYISDEELKYLKDKIKSTHANVPPAPWRYILTSSAVWALIIITLGNAWGFLTIVSDMPKFMRSVLKLSAQKNGYFSSIPYFMMWINGFFVSWIADNIIAKEKLTVTAVRKIAGTIASIGPAIFLVAAAYAGNNGFVVVLLQSIGLTLMGFTFCSAAVNVLDLSPNYASSIMGITNGIACVGGMLSPYIVGVITPHQTIDEWRLVFWIVFVIAIVTNTVYLIYGSGQVQEWNDPAFVTKKRIVNKEEVREGIHLLPGDRPEKSAVGV